MQEWYQVADPRAQKRERQKARELRQSQWWKAQIARGVCHYCESQISPADLTMDHLIPISRGGESKKSNVVPACKACNTEKRAKTPVDMIIESWSADNNP